MKKFLLINTDSLIFSEKSFYIACGFLIAYAIIGTIFLECFYVSYDVWEHIPQIMAFKDNPFSPVDPYLRGDNVSHLLTPYHFILGVISRLTEVTPLLVFSIAGIFNLFFFLISVKVLAKNYFGDKKYSLIILFVLLFAWLFPPGSSGYYNFALIPLTLAYPYRAVLPFMLIVIAKYNTNQHSVVYFMYTISGAIAFAIHPISGIFILMVMFTKTILDDGGWSRKRALQLLLPFCSLLLTFLWPFYPILGFILSATKKNIFNLPDAYKFYYETIWTLLVLLIPFLIVLCKRIKTAKIDFVVALSLLLVPPLVFNYFTLNNEPIARMIVYLTLMAHLFLIEWIIGVIERREIITFRFLFAIFTILFILQVPFSLKTISLFPEAIKGKPIGYFSNFRYYNDYQNLDKLITDNGMILAPMPVSVMISRTTHQYVVAYYYPNPAIPGTKEKSADVDKYFSTSSSLVKNSILKKYKVKYLITKENISSLSKQGLKLTQLGSIDEYPVYRILNINEQSPVSP